MDYNHSRVIIAKKDGEKIIFKWVNPYTLTNGEVDLVYSPDDDPTPWYFANKEATSQSFENLYEAIHVYLNNQLEWEY